MKLKISAAISLLLLCCITFAIAQPSRPHVIQNGHLKIEFVQQDKSFASANIYSRPAEDWVLVATWKPLFRIAVTNSSGDQTFEPLPTKVSVAKQPHATKSNSALFTATQRAADGTEWTARLSVLLDSTRPIARVHYEWKANRDAQVKSLLGPNIYVSDGTNGAAKSWGLFPGLEFLYGAERSSNPRDFAPNLADRRTPHPYKVSVPLMAVTIGEGSQSPVETTNRFFCPESLKDSSTLHPLSSTLAPTTIALLWNPLQRWDGVHQFPSPRFASPNFDESAPNHRLALFLPGTPEFVKENRDATDTPYTLSASNALSLDSTLLVTPGSALVALKEWLRDNGGLPKPNPWPRPFQKELDVCRAGFLKTVWDEKSQGWRHCIDWPSAQSPGYCALLWTDAHVAENEDARDASRVRVELAVTNMLRNGEPSLMSQSGCHIMQWEFPFLYGHLPGAMVGIDAQVQQLISTQRPDGGWVFKPEKDNQKNLGAEGDSVLGICANRAATILRYARITGDTNALAAGERALRFMERFRVPRGGQVWECPMYEPDILPAGYAVRAYHEGWRVTGNPRWLRDAVYWAETGVPFLYLWSLPDKPMMLGATLPVFGSTFYTHTWLAVPVQWNGLVYAYHVLHLAQELERNPLAEYDSTIQPFNDSTTSPLPLSLNFKPPDWKRVAELITISAMHQQFADGEKIGAYPDSIANFETRNPAFINPEDIMLNVLALKGHDPEIHTARVKLGERDVTISSGAKIRTAETDGNRLKLELAGFAHEPCQALLFGVRPKEILVDGKTLPQSTEPLRRALGWWWDEKTQRAYVTTPGTVGRAVVEIVGE